MDIAVLSGKGGTGKTLLSVNLAAAAEKSVYIDCDVEEPNGYLFFKPENIETEKVSVKIPYVNKELCDGCRKCVDFCKFNALALVGKYPFVFEEICHSCGGCVIVCPQGAMSEKDKVIGEIQKGRSENVEVVTGMLNTGEASGIPIIKKILPEKNNKKDVLNVIDCPPGSACIVMESIKDADYCILVAEPTIFGTHNLKMVYDLVKLFDKPYGVVLNKCLEGENPSEKFCMENSIKILGKIPFDSEIGEINSNAEILVREDDKYKKLFANLLETVIGEVQNETIANS
ncbi:nucleotide-binding protein [Proteocatella sphenisci]|uniref:nucleotide-binding protein n=1 Tax=Proteocatella sphenisci TaxID=181070 RepID=UPI00048A7EC1|nr:ATP-binding protein [Proteocatella sphenisci]